MVCEQSRTVDPRARIEEEVARVVMTALRAEPGSLLDQRDHQLIAKIRTPTIFIAGSLDPVGYPGVEQQAAMLKAARPDVKVVILDNIGHWAMYEAPERVNELLLSELA